MIADYERVQPLDVVLEILLEHVLIRPLVHFGLVHFNYAQLVELNRSCSSFHTQRQDCIRTVRRNRENDRHVLHIAVRALCVVRINTYVSLDNRTCRVIRFCPVLRRHFNVSFPVAPVVYCGVSHIGLSALKSCNRLRYAYFLGIVRHLKDRIVVVGLLHDLCGTVVVSFHIPRIECLACEVRVYKTCSLAPVHLFKCALRFFSLVDNIWNRCFCAERDAAVHDFDLLFLCSSGIRQLVYLDS